ncbi:hypothetical protein EUGRSUZ_I01648 [Eucalyptus grandis]|uniref:Uncharacterized protein n=2 Tax=Eucalyptus grandis TaxID=71139 RepID=A0ACC3JHN6_EUCGR|nr:hypothetical protein EUGRSUZ_I01648 [Eucalyptus grandis]
MDIHVHRIYLSFRFFVIRNSMGVLYHEKLILFNRAFIKKKGRNNVTVDDLVHVITPKGRASVPDPVKADLLQRIRTFLNSVI